MEITLLHSPRSPYQKDFFTSAASGIRKHGGKASVSYTSAQTKAVACWGWRKGQELRDKGHNVLVFERGYLGDRFEWTSIAWNGLNGYGDFCLPERVSPKRFKDHFELKPWKEHGKHIIIMGQLRGDMSLQGQDLTAFYDEVAKHLWDAYRKHIWFKPHPMGLTNGKNFTPNIPIFPGDLDSALADAYLVVTFNSNSGVDAVINGIPALSFDSGSMAYEVTGHAVYDRILPNRERWAEKLAHCQWSPEEIAGGDYWPRMRCKLEA